MLISVVGKSGSGKSTISRELSKMRNTICIDIDKVGHEVNTYPEVIEEIKNHFGSDVIENGLVNRRKLSTIVFGSEVHMDLLAQITWKHMSQVIDKRIKENPEKIIILDWIRLPETEYFKKSDYTILMDTPYEERLRRVMLRDKISKEEFDLRECASPNYDKISFDWVVKSEPEEQIRKEVMKIYEKSCVPRKF